MKSKHERFQVIGAARVQKVLDSIDSLAKCSNKNNYEYNEQDVKKMLNVIKDKVRQLEIAYTISSSSNKETFKF